MQTLNNRQVTEFCENGFVLTPDVFEPAELDRFGAAVDAVVAERTHHDTRRLSDKSTYEQSFIQCMRLWETAPEVRPFTFHQGLAAIAGQLLGVDKLLLWQDQALYKEADGRMTTPHQDQPFWAIGNAPLISAWIPLSDVTLNMGAMGYVPGSHKVGGLTRVDITHRTEPYDILADPALGGRKPVWVEAPAGAVIWHHGFTVHQAAPNQSAETRRVFTVVYIACGYPRTESWTTFPLDRAGVGLGEEIKGPGLPLAWPRSPGDYPEPPELIGRPIGPQRHRNEPEQAD